MALWLYILSVPVPGLLLACVPVRRARCNALAEPAVRWKYLLRLTILAAVPIVLAAIALSHVLDNTDSKQFWLVACVPGLALATVRLAIEARHLKKFRPRPVR
ncbi:hypothetical protein ACQPYH_02840 [Kribbella sp. CA-245084]|uniref:hypothetical protein n=1 Tax=Kribbella sp. CA-245084 TaxID=3239940 RepID=UPI003D943E7F